MVNPAKVYSENMWAVTGANKHFTSQMHAGYWSHLDDQNLDAPTKTLSGSVIGNGEDRDGRKIVCPALCG